MLDRDDKIVSNNVEEAKKGNKQSAGKKAVNGYILYEAESFNRAVRRCVNIFFGRFNIKPHRL